MTDIDTLGDRLVEKRRQIKEMIGKLQYTAKAEGDGPGGWSSDPKLLLKDYHMDELLYACGGLAGVVHEYHEIVQKINSGRSS